MKNEKLFLILFYKNVLYFKSPERFHSISILIPAFLYYFLEKNEFYSDVLESILIREKKIDMSTERKDDDYFKTQKDILLYEFLVKEEKEELKELNFKEFIKNTSEFFIKNNFNTVLKTYFLIKTLYFIVQINYMGYIGFLPEINAEDKKICNIIIKKFDEMDKKYSENNEFLKTNRAIESKLGFEALKKEIPTEEEKEYCLNLLKNLNNII